MGSYDDLREGPIHPSQITKNGTALFNFINGLAHEISATEENELIARNVNYTGRDGRVSRSFHHSKIPILEDVGNNMARMMNEGYYARQKASETQNYIHIPLNDLLNADKVFNNLTQGSRKPVYEQTFTTEEPKTMTDDDISMYLGGGSQKRTVPQQSTNNTFYVNMDKTTKALLGEQVKTNKLLGILVQTIREKFDELPQHLAEVIAASNLPDAEIMNDEQYEQMQTEAQGIDESLLP